LTGTAASRGRAGNSAAAAGAHGIEVRDATVQFQVESGLAARLHRRKPLKLTALDGVNLSIGPRSSLGIVGESGCGKSTLARVLVGLVPLTSGSLLVDGRELGTDRDKAMRRRIQMVFQDPSSSLNPARTVGQTLAELLRAHDLVSPRDVKARCHQLLDLVGLPSATIDSKPRQLSGGQRQRVGIARALALEPEVLIADEAVAALDVSVQALVLNLLAELREELDLALVFISHDLSVVRHISEELLVMYMGRVVESGPTDKVFRDPRHPYTRALIAAAPEIHTRKRSGEGALAGEPPSPLELPRGCRFAPRCPLRFDRCSSEDPALLGDADHQAACLLQD
jgi:oligopeptide/dipeptide ABC transporter ATP-binding protein